MKVLIINVRRNRKEQAVRAESTVEGDPLRLGRGAQCEIHLPDPRVSLDHAAIFRDGESLSIRAQHGELVVDGSAVQEARLSAGVQVALGPYDISVESAPEGYDLALAIELSRPLPDDLEGIRARSITSLEATALSKRVTAWALAIVIAILFFALPTIWALNPTPLQPKSKLSAALDASWNPGPLAAGHQAFAQKCGVCHETAFVRVLDRACLECHTKTPGHAPTVALQQRLFGGQRCASCHVEHKGTAAIVRRDSDLCITCHRDLKGKMPDTTLANATDFATNHPGFKVTIWQGPGKNDVVRVAQTDKAKLVQRSHLKFPHDEHLKTSLRGPKGRKTLDCRSCHVPDTSGRGFEPIAMKTACVECHTLEFEPAVTTRQVPHGSVDDALLTIQEFYASIALNNIPVDVVNLGAIRREIPNLPPGELTEEERQRALAWVKKKTKQIGKDLFEMRVCIVCHDVTRVAGPPVAAGVAPTWRVTPVRIADVWLPKSRFDHQKHRTYKCADCHDVLHSHSSTDIVIPDIANCRKCHGGNKLVANKVVSTCVACHDFHLPGHPVFGAQMEASASFPRTR
jgi:predicted CXXCH cytochrome family protein